MDLTPLARTVLERLGPVFGGAADGAKAASMGAYMRDQFAFLGIPTPQRRALSRQVLSGLARPDEDDLRTAADRLFRYCLAQAAHRDFFVRKAIGWALREYAKTNPDGVRAFVRAHERALSPLSVREALKNL